MKLSKLTSGLLVLCCYAAAQTVTFDFDTATPALGTGQNVPFDQTAGGLTAHFSSPSIPAPAFSIQTDVSTGWRLSQFSGPYVYDNNVNANALDIKFSQPVTSISFVFATADFQQVEVPTSVQLTAYVDSTASTPVGSALAHGTYANDTMPMGTLTFTAGGRPFNLVEILIPRQALAAADFFVDNVTVTPVANAVYSVSAASYAPGAALAAEAIVGAFGQGMASGTAKAETLPLPTTLAGAVVLVKDSAGVERPAPLFYVSPGQINYEIPEGTAPGAATISVTSAGQVTATGATLIDSVAPGIFTANADGAGAPAGNAISVAPDGTQTVLAVAQCGTSPGSCLPVPIDLGPAGMQVYLVLYGTGIRGRSSPGNVTATIGGASAAVAYAGPQGTLVGLDQLNILIPPALAGRGEVDVALAVDGKTANPVRISIQ